MGVFNAIAAAAAARAASELAQKIAGVAERHGAIRAGANQEREAGIAVEREGYRLEASQASLAAVDEALRGAAEALQARGPDDAGPHLDTAEGRLAQAVAEGSGAPALRAENDRRLAELEARGQAAAATIARGREAFDIVDEFAESTWQDIRGNGSEAQAAANRAQEHWELARQGNTMEQQAFYPAKEHLDSAGEELDYVDKLIDAILTRLKDLEAARDNARALLAEAERSIGAGLEFVRANDADVGKGPEVQLQEAARQLAAAQAEAGQAKPNWLQLVAAATEADRLADEALAGARGEAETIQKLRDQAARLAQVVSGEISGIAKFINVHDGDISAQTQSAVRSLIARFEQTRGLEAGAVQQQEERRRAALEQLVAAWNGLLPETKRVSELAQADVKRLEQLRSEMNAALTEARGAIERAQHEAREAGMRASRNERDRLQAVEASFAQIRLPITGEENIKRTTEQARAIASEARDLASDLDRHTRPPTGGAGPIIISTGGWGGSGGWSGGGGSSGPSWGGSNRSGGSFGGGSSGGGFGGGSSGGGW